MSGYPMAFAVHCACRDCFEITLTSDVDGAYCADCIEARCSDYQGMECQRPMADGGDADDAVMP